MAQDPAVERLMPIAVYMDAGARLRLAGRIPAGVEYL
jgi:hypothetical protein